MVARTEPHFQHEAPRNLPIPARFHPAPVANCFAESWIGSLKRECLNLLFCFSLGQLDHIVQTYAEYHNEYRPHQRRGNRPLGNDADPAPMDLAPPETVHCRQWLGGLLKHYYRKAA